MKPLLVEQSAASRVPAWAALTASVALVVLAAAQPASPAVAVVPSAGSVAVYCVEKEPDRVLGVQLHPGVRRCVPGPEQLED